MILCLAVLVASLAGLTFGRRLLPKGAKKGLLVLASASLLGIAEEIAMQQDAVLMEGDLLKRNENGEGDYNQELELSVEGLMERRDFPITVYEQRLTEEERGYLNAALEEIRTEFPGENESLDCIRERVKIRDAYQNGKVKAEWYFDNYELMDFEGNVIGEELDENGEMVRAEVELQCQELKCLEEFYFCVFPPRMGEEETFLAELNRNLAAQEKMSGAQYLELPRQIGNYKIEWKNKKDNTSEKIVLLGVLLVCFFPLLEKSRAQEKKEKRIRQLAMEYPDIVSKLALLIGSGMTLSGAWNKIAYTYERNRKNNAVSMHPAYEEMLITSREFESGIGEERAYERFGERCKSAGYRRLGNILSQNLRKGNRGIVALLEKEAEEAFVERKSTAKKLGEEAGTKMLIPMMFMLGIVMVILIVPAIYAFQM